MTIFKETRETTSPVLSNRCETHTYAHFARAQRERERDQAIAFAALRALRAIIIAMLGDARIFRVTAKLAGAPADESARKLRRQRPRKSARPKGN